MRKNNVAIDYKSADEGGVGRGTVVYHDGRYRMWFSYRGESDFRSGQRRSYRIGFAESRDSEHWQRENEKAGIDVWSGDDWDSEMVAYPYVFAAAGELHLFHNGNGFSQSEIGRAVLIED